MTNKRRLLLIECNIDDMNPEFWPYIIELLLESGARDAWLTPVIMKLGRPGQCLSVLCDPEQEELISGLIFAETSTLGIRVRTCDRLELARNTTAVDTPFGSVRMKIAVNAAAEVLNMAPEISDCQAIAKASGVPLKTVYEAAVAAYKQRK